MILIPYSFLSAFKMKITFSVLHVLGTNPKATLALSISPVQKSTIFRPN